MAAVQGTKVAGLALTASPRPGRRLLRTTGLWVAILLFAAVPAAASHAGQLTNERAAQGYRFGVFPYLPALTIDRLFGPIANAFAAELDRPVYLKTKSTFDKFAAELEREAYDIIFVHPFFYIRAVDQHNYQPLAHLNQQLRAAVLVKNEQPGADWSDLEGKTLALPPALAAVSEMAKVALMDAGLLPGVDVTLQHHRTKVSCLQAVAVDSADACGLPEFVLPQLNPIGGAQLRVLARTPPISSVAFAAHARIPAVERQRLLDAILAWPGTEAGRKLLQTGHWPGFVATQDGDYDAVRRYGIRLGILAQR